MRVLRVGKRRANSLVRASHLDVRKATRISLTAQAIGFVRQVFLYSAIGLAASAIAATVTTVEAAAEEDARPLDPKKVKFFEEKIRPVLVDRCHACHSQTAGKSKGELLVDSRDGLRRGGESGPALIPGDASKSLLIRLLKTTDRDEGMPPKGAGERLNDATIRDFETWINDGAVDPRDMVTRVAKTYDTSKALEWWAFQPIKQVAPPPSRAGEWARTEIDRFIERGWAERGLRPVGDASGLQLLRRLRFDLTGLPPTEAEVSEFTAAGSDSRRRSALLEATVDRLLASPQYGEKWGRHWLDVARFAESSGKDVNVVFPHAWRYRDYVIEAFNEDLPFDRFLAQQLAGDLLPARDERERARNVIATGFLALGPKSLNDMNPRQFAVDQADEQIDATTQAFLALTVACARCHDHRFDPVSQRDYTALAGIFLSTDTRFGTAGGVQGRNQSSLVELPAAIGLPVVAPSMSPRELADKRRRLEQLQQEARSALGQRAGGRTPTDGLTNFDVVRIITQSKQLETELSLVNADGSAKPVAMGVVDRPSQPPQQPRGPGRQPGRQPGQPPGRARTSGFEQLGDSPLFGRGDLRNEGERVPRGTPGLLVAGYHGTDPSDRFRAAAPGTSGRRELSEALTSTDNPLVARVIVNRVWSWLFGRGIVSSVDNFGATGALPSDPELLDYLALRFRNDGWSIKRLVRSIVVSRAYQLATTHDEANFAADPENAGVWRHAPRRLEAEELHDALLAVAGRLNEQRPIGSLVGRVYDGPIGGERRMALTEEQISRASHRHRALYLPLTRNVQPDLLAVFDQPDAATVRGQRDATNVPSQALFLLNGQFVEEQAEALADQLTSKFAGSDAGARFDDRLKAAFIRTLGREPRASETAAARRLLEAVMHSGESRRASETWKSVVRGLMSSAEFRTVD
ncbi:MAG TPA: PSD1 and planctomycete cytochrome C domain-containing protein [Pirellulaceae bacterium]|nr:PSD1 and planctomycete cytochrome C domain-containing protein [Pirellulaceae bacterium]